MRSNVLFGHVLQFDSPQTADINNGTILHRILKPPRQSSTRTILTILLCSALCAANASAQSVISGRSKSFDFGLGYSYMSHPNGESGRLGLFGGDAAFTIGLRPHLGIRADVGYARAAHVLGTPSHSTVLTYLAGPVFYPTTQRNFSTYVHALFGGARVSGPVPYNNLILLGGWTTGYAWAFGTGFDYRLSRSMTVRTGVDYLRTSYYGPTLRTQGQNNIRATAAVVYVFGSQPRGRER